jgi:sodium-dependent dicarboxylate transporter 2/3/5
MWLSNTATAAMMFPIGLSIVSHLGRHCPPNDPAVRRFATVMMLITAFGCSIGGLATPIGTPPNLIGLGMLRNLAGVDISFFRWMLMGVPLAVVMYLVLAAYFTVIGARRLSIGTESADLVRSELRRLGRVSPAERNVFLAFGVTVALWILPGVLAIVQLHESAFARAYAAAVPESVAALIGAILLFLLPVNWRARRFTLTWGEAVRIDWGTILLFGGGLSLGSLAFHSGLAEAMGKGITGWLPAQTSFALTLVFTLFSVLLTETTSNTAAANMVVPIAIAVSQAAGISPIQPALGATLGASLAFMLPISTPPNAIVYSSGHVPITSMIKYGTLLDLAGIVLAVAAVMFLAPGS